MARQPITIELLGLIECELDGQVIINASQVSIQLSTPVNKQKSGYVVAVSDGIPDPKGSMKLIPDADGRLPNSLDIALNYRGKTLVVVWGNRRYMVSNFRPTDANASNDQGQGTVDDALTWEAATFKQIA